MSWKRFTIVIVSICSMAGVVKLVQACAGGDDYYGGSSFFLNTVSKDPAYVPFYYNPYLTFYTDGYSFDNKEFDANIPDPVTGSWAEYTKNTVADADIDSFVYRFAAKDVFNLYEHIGKGYTLQVPQVMEQNALTQWFIKNKDAEAVLYLSFAKQCEPYALPMEDHWNAAGNYEISARDSAGMQELVHESIKQCQVVKNSETRWRYLYQAMRMAFYSREYAQTIMLFNTLVTERSNSFLYYRCLALKAGALYKTGQKASAAYLYSLAFDKSDEQKKSAYTSFRWATGGNVTALTSLCKNDHERAVLYVMQGLYDYGDNSASVLSSLSNAYRYDPAIKGLDIVTTRAINKIESNAIPGIVPDTNRKNKQLTDISAFAQKVAKEGKNGDAAYWTLVSAYISILQGNAADCKKHLDKAAALHMTGSEDDVHSIINILYIARKGNTITAKTEAELLPALKQLQEKATENNRFHLVVIDILLCILKPMYLKQGNINRAIYCYAKTGMSGSYPYGDRFTQDFTDDAGQMLEAMTPERLQQVEAFVAKNKKTPFEAWLTDSTCFNTDILRELEATKYIREYHFDKAIAILKTLSGNGIQPRQLPDATISHLKEMQDWNKDDSALIYNKLGFAEKMLELQQALEKNPDDARVAYQYANGLYNMSYYGKAHHACDYYRSSTDDLAYYTSPARKKLQPCMQEYYGLATAEKYYMRAFEHSTDREVQARCLFMAAKCWQKNAPLLKEDMENGYWTSDETGYYQYSFRNPHFAELNAAYRSTKFFNTAYSTCTYFRDYAITHR